MIEEFSNLENGSAACTLIFRTFFTYYYAKGDGNIMVILALCGLAIGGLLTTICLPVIQAYLTSKFNDK